MTAKNLGIRFLFTIFTFIIFFRIASSSSLQDKTKILTILNEFYQKTNGNQWIDQSGWKDGSNYCASWFGLICDAEEFPVEIRLENNNLSGVIPSSFWTLTSVRILSLKNNSLEGNIPNEIGNFSLEVLDLSNNFFYGKIPESIGGITELRILSLTNNMIGGTIPKSIGNLVKLEEFYANSNAIEGIIPEEIGSTNLKILDLSTNELTGRIPYSIGKLTNLQTLNLSENDFREAIPTTIENCINLEYFLIASNEIHGNIPQGFENLTKLKHLNCVDNSIEGEVLLSQRWSQLEIYECSGNLITGQIPKNLDKWYPNMIYFDLSLNQIIGELPNLPPSVTAIYLDENNISGEIPSSWKNLVEVYDMYLDSNQLSGNIPDIFANMSKLINLAMRSNNFTGEIPPLDGLINIENLWMGRNRLNGTIPSIVGQFDSLLTLDLSNNQITGEIPLLESKSLNILDVSSNILTGTLANLKNSIILQLNVSNNQLSGRVFSDDTAYINLYQSFILIDLSHNQFSGPFFAGESVDLPANLIYLDISHNQFSGTIRTPLHSDGLLTLLASHNQMEGYILGNLYTLTSLTMLDLSHNQIKGSLPRSFLLLRNLKYLNLDFNSLFGIVAIPQSLISLSLRGNKLKNTDFNFLIGNDQLEVIDLSLNMINASFPSVIGGEFGLKYIDISNNSIYGEVPKEVCLLKEITTFNIRGNMITGQICTFISDIIYLDLSDNFLSGDTKFLSNLPSLEHVDICNNLFIGDISSFLPFIKLRFFDCNNNQLNGSIPNFVNLPELESIDLSFNNFSGSVSSFNNCPLLSNITLNDNFFSEASSFALSSDFKIECNMKNIPFICPVSWEAFEKCGAKCVLGPNGTVSQSMRIYLECLEGGFQWNAFQKGFSQYINVSVERLSLISQSFPTTKRGIVGFVDVLLTPPNTNSENQGSPSRVIQLLKEKRISNLIIGDYLISSFESPIPQNTLPMTSVTLLGREPFPIGLVVGLSVGFGFLLIIVIAILGFFWIRRGRRIEPPQMWDIDLSKINFGAAKKSIINYDDLKKMTFIGSGGFGIVYKANWREFKVAVKQIKAEHVNEEQLTSFLREVSILQNLRAHPNVVLFIGLTVPPQPLSLVTEFCEGGGLDSYLTTNAVSEAQMMKFVTGIALGMLHLHLEKIVHRDLAARNVLLTKHLEPKVTDFGLSRSREEPEGVPSTTASNVGPLKWMAPESILNREYSYSSDTFSFGVVIWEIVTRKEPFEGIPALEAAIAIARDGLRLKIPKDSPEILQSLMEACWKEVPNQRPTFETICGILGVNTDSTVFNPNETFNSGSSQHYPTIDIEPSLRRSNNLDQTIHPVVNNDNNHSNYGEILLQNDLDTMEGK
eukprot:TRINITY_DN3239_c0_g1_i1.p1 TRINITY_DN3239_c0_g1~~TRINITY_DN3239_c0_g1_i1.p1  ORF type:complete len:1365 (+),score=254.10 TRINITY_DN3239_c0_g1_i1:56-4150(+)